MEVSAGAGRIDEEPAMEFLAAHQAEMGHGHHVDGGEVASVKNRAALPRRGEPGQPGQCNSTAPPVLRGFMDALENFLASKFHSPVRLKTSQRNKNIYF